MCLYIQYVPYQLTTARPRTHPMMLLEHVSDHNRFSNKMIPCYFLVGSGRQHIRPGAVSDPRTPALLPFAPKALGHGFPPFRVGINWANQYRRKSLIRAYQRKHIELCRVSAEAGHRIKLRRYGSRSPRSVRGCTVHTSALRARTSKSLISPRGAATSMVGLELQGTVVCWILLY
jgi:hypothetical protein